MRTVVRGDEIESGDELTGRQAIDPAWAWEAYEPDAKRPWDTRLAAHVLRRSRFGFNADQLAQAMQEGPGRTIERLMAGGPETAAIDAQIDAIEQRAIDPGAATHESPRQWWLRRLIVTDHPLRERVTLFWHSHFGVSNDWVKSGLLVTRHIQLLRGHALGDFRELMAAIVRDPAVLLSHDAATGRRHAPSLTLGRALLEQFTVGPGQASASDIEAAARACTGMFVLRRELRDLPHEHDEGMKRLFGQEGAWTETDVARIACAQPATARHITARLFRDWIADTWTPSGELIEPLASAFEADRDVGRLIERMLRSNLFFSEHAYRQRAKSPVEFAVGLVRMTGSLVPTGPLGADLAALGQDLGRPPTTRGWRGGRAWLTQATLLERARLVSKLLAGAEPYERGLDLAGAVKNGDEPLRELLTLMIDGGFDPAALDAAVPKSAELTPAVAMGSIAALPEFQVG